ncbi:MAG: Mce related protein [Pedosphaera sp.]|nr:Mce related protein [Pedosphaera sp.]
MALQDLTPQLRTRLSRMERAVGWFVLLATLLFISGFAYYIYTTAERKGWFKIKAPYYTYAESGDGLSVGDQVKLMGFPAGTITEITAMPPQWGSYTKSNVFIAFVVLQPFYGYLWSEGSLAEVNESGFLGKRELNLTKGTNGHATYLTNVFRVVPVAVAQALPHLDKWRLGEDLYVGTNLELKAWQPLSPEVLQKVAGLGKTDVRVIDPTVGKKSLTAIWNNEAHYYEPFTKSKRYGLPPDETPALNARLKGLVAQVEGALPNFLRLTNDLTSVLTNSAQLTSNLNIVAQSARPMITNLTAISEHLKEPQGSLGEWLIPTNMNPKLDTILQNANLTLTNANTNLTVLADELSRSLDSLANVTSNLNNQVQSNTNILTRISDAIVHSDQFVQGLKRHWLFRSAFRTPKTNTPAAQVVEPARSPRDKTSHGE